MKKGDVGMAKRFSKSTETRDELSTMCNPKVMSRCLSTPDATHWPRPSIGDPLPRFDFVPKNLRVQMLTKFISIDSYSPEVRAFGTLITSTKVVRLIICKTRWLHPKTILYLDVWDSVPK